MIQLILGGLCFAAAYHIGASDIEDSNTGDASILGFVLPFILVVGGLYILTIK